MDSVGTADVVPDAAHIRNKHHTVLALVVNLVWAPVGVVHSATYRHQQKVYATYYRQAWIDICAEISGT